MPALIALFACTSGPADSADSAATVDSAADSAADSADGAGALSAPPPEFSPEQAVDVINGLAVLLPDQQTLLADWRGLFEGVSGLCPVISGQYSTSSPFSGCHADDGREWAGYAVYGGDLAVNGEITLEADASVTNTAGDTFLAAGNVAVALEADGTWSSVVVGTWGGDHHPDWTSWRPSVSLWAEGDATSLTGYGGVSLFNDALYVADARWDATSCPGATGTVSVRDPNGWWFELVLDEDCSGCGELTWDGEGLGRVCVELGARLGEIVDRRPQ